MSSDLRERIHQWRVLFHGTSAERRAAPLFAEALERIEQLEAQVTRLDDTLAAKVRAEVRLTGVATFDIPHERGGGC